MGRPPSDARSYLEAAVTASIEQQWPLLFDQPHVVHPAYDDDVIAGVVFDFDGAVEERKGLVEHRRTRVRTGAPSEASEAIRALRGERPTHLFLV